VFHSLVRIRYLAALVVLILVVHSMGFLAIGVIRGIQAYSLLAQGPPWDGEQRPGLHVAESVDALLFTLVLLVLALGTASLFLASPGKDSLESLPEWMRVKNLTQLKLQLWEAILAAMVVAAVISIIADLHSLEWRHLVMPVAILILSVSYYLLKQAGARD
jgi:uncharacterized membrane protein YqhA